MEINANWVTKIERELAQAKSVIAEQKETIERLQSEIDIEEKRFNQLADDYSEQAALIEVLAEALTESHYCSSTKIALDKYNEALRAYTEWKESK